MAKWQNIRPEQLFVMSGNVVGGCSAGEVVKALETLLGYGQVLKVFDVSQWHDKFKNFHMA